MLSKALEVEWFVVDEELSAGHLHCPDPHGLPVDISDWGLICGADIHLEGVEVARGRVIACHGPGPPQGGCVHHHASLDGGGGGGGGGGDVLVDGHRVLGSVVRELLTPHQPHIVSEVGLGGA